MCSRRFCACEERAPEQAVCASLLPSLGTEPKGFLHTSPCINTHGSTRCTLTQLSHPWEVNRAVALVGAHWRTCRAGETLLSLTGQIPKAPSHIHTHSIKHTLTCLLFPSLRARLERCFQNCWSVGNMTLSAAESDMQTHAHEPHKSHEPHKHRETLL